MRAVARLVALAELAFGLAHALNNALTAIVGETSFLHGDPKEPGEIDAACQVILEQVERCGRMTRGVLMRRPAPGLARGECDLVRMLRDVEPLLRDALSRRIELSVETPEEPLLVPVDPVDLETLLLLLAQRAARAGAGAVHVSLRASVGDVPDEACLELEVIPARVAADGSWREPAPGPEPSPADTLLAALMPLLGARAEEREAPRKLVTRIRLARIAER